MNTVMDSVVFKFIYCHLVSSNECLDSFRILGSGFINEKYSIIGFLITSLILILILIGKLLLVIRTNPQLKIIEFPILETLLDLLNFHLLWLIF